ncbi:MAG: hypothetical protein AAF716_13535 [Cyanobacteria bacterium P01_D01_bin.1]
MEPPIPPSSSFELSAAADARLAAWWLRYGQRLLQVGIGLMVAAALWRVGLELPRLIWGQQEFDAVDLINRHTEVHRWFSGLPVYGAVDNGDYPPASYAMLWPLVGWLDLAAARWLWAISTLLMLGWLAQIGIHQSLATTRWEKISIALMPFALYPASATMSMGQLATHVMPPLVVGLMMMVRSRPSGETAGSDLISDLIAASLVIFALVKPTMSVPFFWIACFAPGRWRPAFLVSAGYVALAWVATQFQAGGLRSLHIAWIDQAGTQLGTRGHANVHTWLEAIGLSDWMLPASLALFVATGIWTLRHRRVDPWILLGVAALVARFWTDHRMFDDLLLWVPMIALFRLAKVPAFGQTAQLTAAFLFVLNWLALMGPARFLSEPLSLSSPLEIAIKSGHAVLWLSSLVFFLMLARSATAPKTP